MLEIIFRRSADKCQNRRQSCQLGVNLCVLGTEACWSLKGTDLNWQGGVSRDRPAEPFDPAKFLWYRKPICCYVQPAGWI